MRREVCHVVVTPTLNVGQPLTMLNVEQSQRATVEGKKIDNVEHYYLS